MHLGLVNTFGDYDSVHFNWNLMPLNMTTLYMDAWPLTAFSAAPIDLNTTYIGYPPLHLHHFQVYSYGTDSHAAEFFDHSGDAQCTAHSNHKEMGDSTSCFKVDYLINGYAKWMPNQEYYLDAYLNDVRPRGSQLLAWGFRLSMTLGSHPRVRGARALSLFLMQNPFDGHGPSTYDIPRSDSFLYYVAHMPCEGVLAPAYTWLHTHSLRLQQSFLVSATPEQLGLKHRLLLRDSCVPLITSHTPYESNAALRNHLLSTLWSVVQEDRIVCEAQSSFALIDGLAYDRAQRVHCKPWHFEKGELFTVLAFHAGGSVSLAPLSSSETTSQSKSMYQMHIQWYMHFTASDNASHFTRKAFHDHSQSLEEGNCSSACCPSTHKLLALSRVSPELTIHSSVIGLLSVTLLASAKSAAKRMQLNGGLL